MKNIILALIIVSFGAMGATAQTTKKQSTTVTQRTNTNGAVTSRKTTTKTTTRRRVADPNATNGSRFPTGTYETPTGTQPDYNATKREKARSTNGSGADGAVTR